MRVVSLAPSATATLSAMGAAGQLVGVTHHCERLDGWGDGGDGVAASLPDPVGGWLDPDPAVIAARDPDLLLASDALQAETVADLRDRGYEVYHDEPATLEDVLDSFRRLGEAVGHADTGRELAEEARERLDRVAAAVSGRDTGSHGIGRPVVYCEEWSDPPMAAGNWVPDAVRAAGGRYPFVESGERSHEIDGDAVVDADPDYAILHVCGHGDRVDPATIHDRDWALDAEVHVLDDALLNQPSPRLIEGIERLAGILHG